MKNQHVQNTPIGELDISKSKVHDERELPSGFLDVDSVNFNVSKLLETERQVLQMAETEREELKVQNGYSL